MNKQEKEKRIKELTWRYFHEQKTKEVFSFLMIAILIIFLPYLLGIFIGDGYSVFCDGATWEEPETECGKGAIWMEGLIYIGIISFILLIVFTWFDNNWDKAEERATKEVRGKKWNK